MVSLLPKNNEIDRAVDWIVVDWIVVDWNAGYWNPDY
jgi:hypothetical protein